MKRGFKTRITGVPVSEIKLKLQSLNDDNFKDVNVNIDNKSPTDPLFEKEWYLVSIVCHLRYILFFNLKTLQAQYTHIDKAPFLE